MYCLVSPACQGGEGGADIYTAPKQRLIGSSPLTFVKGNELIRHNCASANYWAIHFFPWQWSQSNETRLCLSFPVILGQTANELILNLGIFMKFI